MKGEERPMRLGNRKSIDFLAGYLVWKTIPDSLNDKFPDFHKICTDENCSVNDLYIKNWRLKFWRWLNEGLQDKPRRLHNILFRYKINDDIGVAIWNWENEICL